jgi:NAD(P)-dependent dehydrogenase (short-subunit alcohol dehydrogenase family)
VVTGASSGIGLAASVAFARRGGAVVLVGRDEQRLKDAVETVTAAGGPPPLSYEADFSRLDDVHILADKLRDRVRRINVLANNAGLMTMRKRTTVDGYELTIQVNHLAGFLLANLLREQLRGGRIISTASDTHRSGAPDPDALSAQSGFAAYGPSKSANILFGLEATRRWPDIMSVSFHPGWVRTLFGRGTPMTAWFKLNPFLRTPENAADTLVWLATAQAHELRSGGYYIKRTPREPSPHARDPQAAYRLWEASLAAVGLSWDMT